MAVNKGGSQGAYTLFIGAPRDGGFTWPGSAYVFQKNSSLPQTSQWQQAKKIEIPSPSGVAYSCFGWSVDVSDSGEFGAGTFM